MKSILWLAKHKANMNALDKQRRTSAFTHPYH
jgi:hypothetical protein